MQAISELENLLLPKEEPPFFSENGNGIRIVVLKYFRFHKSLCIELYDAATTQAGKIKNPLSAVSASDAALFSTKPDALLFYTAISRFQNNPTAAKSGADIRALKTIIKNPLGLRFFCHNAEFSENVSAGSLEEVGVGGILHKFSLLVNKVEAFYQVIPQLHLEQQVLHPRQVEHRF
ncbi:MAG: hypothetical protein EOO14_20250, partial [Chitinophagaceae bacterium]